MKMHDDLRARLRRGADPLTVGAPQMDRIRRRAAVRRTRRVTGTVLASALVAAAVVVPLVALVTVSGNDTVVKRPGAGESASPGPSSTVQPPDPTQNVLFVANCYISDGYTFGFMLSHSPGDPIELCSRAWRTGDTSGVASISIAADPTVPMGPHATVPPLMECATYGGIVVHVSDDPGYCDAHDMWAIPADYMDTVMRWDATHEAFAGRAFPETDGSCTDPQTAIRVVREELEAHGFTAWTVVDHFNPNSSNGQCAAYSSNFADMQVIIVNDVLS
jgi:hypothetical protein